MKKLNFILLVDDDPIANFLTERILEQLQIANKIQVALNGKEALDIIKNESTKSNLFPDLILLDLKMPVMDGFEFLELFKNVGLKKPENCQIAILTTSNHQKDYNKIMSLGIDTILQKPLTKTQLQRVWEKTSN